MINKKLTGSFYTPKIIADFLVDYLSQKIDTKSNISILEPSAGDGVFIRSVYNHESLVSKIKQVVAVERDKNELEKIESVISHKSFEAVHADFLEFQENNQKKFNFVIGNPPYIKKNLLDTPQIEICESIHKYAQLSNNKIKNIWTAFLVRCIRFLADDGILAFVLPSELLQVKFASELRTLILKEFERVEIFTFNELLFKDCKGQDTLLLIGEKKSDYKGVFYTNIEKLADLQLRKFTLAQNVRIRESKWTHHHLHTDEIELLEKIRGNLGVINDYCTSKAGIVTAANDYFIVNTDTVNEYSLQNYVRPIIQKGSFVNGGVVLSSKDFETLVNDLKPTQLLALDKHSKFKSNQKIASYLNVGVELKINERYKSTIREKWYEVPNIGAAPEAFFFKRCNEYPKLIKNNADVLVTDSAYTVSMNDSFNIEHLIFSFYNSLTLSFAELHGRYYGGGVLELTPNEFKNLPVPYVKLNKQLFNSFVKEFKNKASIKDICHKNDALILKSLDKNLDDDSIKKLFTIREKLFMHRIKTN